jgi:uncharacterized protein YecE (DUF72 family)
VSRIRYGTSSWSESSWVGLFYPPGTKPADFLTHYATQFDTVEVDSTYYALPSADLVRGWNLKTPAGFTLSAKFPRSIVHGGKTEKPDPERVLVPGHVQAETQLFVDHMAEMGDKLGPLVLQFPYFNQGTFKDVGAFMNRLEPFLDSLPVGPRYAVEVRNKAWIAAPLLDLLRSKRVALVLVDLLYMPHPAELAERNDLVTADFLYARLIGDRNAVQNATKTFDRIVVDQGERLDRWAGLLATLYPRVRETYAYANNHYAGFGPETIRELSRRAKGGSSA